MLPIGDTSSRDRTRSLFRRTNKLKHSFLVYFHTYTSVILVHCIYFFVCLKQIRKEREKEKDNIKTRVCHRRHRGRVLRAPTPGDWSNHCERRDDPDVKNADHRKETTDVARKTDIHHHLPQETEHPCELTDFATMSRSRSSLSWKKKTSRTVGTIRSSVVSLYFCHWSTRIWIALIQVDNYQWAVMMSDTDRAEWNSEKASQSPILLTDFDGNSRSLSNSRLLDPSRSREKETSMNSDGQNVRTSVVRQILPRTNVISAASIGITWRRSSSMLKNGMEEKLDRPRTNAYQFGCRITSRSR